MATQKPLDALMIGGETLSRDEFVFVMEYLKDQNQRRAAKMAGKYAPDSVDNYMANEKVQRAIQAALLKRFEIVQVDAAWLQRELMENHYIARYEGKINASNQALMAIGKLNTVDAFAAEKLQVTNAGDVVQRLQRARARRSKKDDAPTDVPNFF